MKTKRPLIIPSALVLGAGLFLVLPARASNACCAPAAATDTAADPAAAFDLAKAKAAYPFDTCVVSGEKLEGDMGGPVDYVHKEAGKPDRLVRFCCKSCIKDFKKDPSKFLKKIDDAPAAKASKPEHHM